MNYKLSITYLILILYLSYMCEHTYSVEVPGALRVDVVLKLVLSVHVIYAPFYDEIRTNIQS